MTETGGDRKAQAESVWAALAQADSARPLDAELRLPSAARLAVLGQPISHSRSPQIHAAAYRVLGLDWQYEAVECGVTDLDAFLRASAVAPAGNGTATAINHLSEAGPSETPWRGLSLTMPLKEEARRLAAVLDPIAEESGVVNTLLHLVGDQWAGFNTDVVGLAAAIQNAGLDATRTVIIGSGATAVSAILAARKLGARHIELYARNVAAVSDLVSRFDGTHGAETGHAVSVSAMNQLPTGAPVVDGALTPTLVISTIPGPSGAELSLPRELWKAPLFDVAYEPWPSPLAERWRDAGGTTHAGTEMLVEQALAQVRIFVGGDPAIPLHDEASVLAAMRLAVSRSVKE